MPVAHPQLRGLILHSGQIAALLAVGLLATGAGPARREPVAPAAPTPAPVVAVAEPAGPPVMILSFDAPVARFPVNSGYGPRHLPGEAGPRLHQGLDYAAPAGSPVLASAPGKVVRVGYEPGGYGRFIEVAHGDGFTSFYAHLSRVDVTTGARVDAGEAIGAVGSTGYSTGPHLHFEVRRGGRRLNPERMFGRIWRVEPVA
jgi:murein DD-endopeptidase MepM/ murein hydrolase activator NlpD